MTIAVAALQFLLLVAGAPLIRGCIARLKAIIQRRQGASVWRPYADLAKLLRKEDLIPQSASVLFRLAPRVLIVVTALAAAFVPAVQSPTLLGGKGDFILFVYLLALGRFCLFLGAMDGGSAFGGMGASREALVSALAEAPLFLALVALAISAGNPTISGIVAWTLGQNFFDISVVHVLAFAALGIVAVAETGRIPVDNPTTHLELTMIHEAMVLEYSGPSLALVEWASAIKLHVVLALLAGLFVPWGMAAEASGTALALAALVYVLKIAGFVVAVAVIESSLAKLRMYLVPDFIGVATAIGILSVFFSAFLQR